MGKNTKIEWTTHTFNPWRGCTKIAPGCQHCYAADLAKRNPSTLGIWGDQGTRVVASEAMWREPLKWDKAAEKAGERHRVFCASLADVFEDWGDNGVVDSDGLFAKDHRSGKEGITLDDVRRRLFALIDATPNLDWLVLTKRPENIPAMVPPYNFHACETGDCPHERVEQCDSLRQRKYRDNVWFGTSISTQADADRNIPALLKCRDLAPVLFVSAEPLLGPIDLAIIDTARGTPLRWVKPAVSKHSSAIDWLIVGGESGPHARPMHPDWACSLRDQCQAAGVLYFFKQWGEYCPFDNRIHDMRHEKTIRIDTTGRDLTQLGGLHDASDAIMYRAGKSAAGRTLDGREWNEFPEVSNEQR